MSTNTDQRPILSNAKRFFEKYILTSQRSPIGIFRRPKVRSAASLTAFVLWLLFPFFCVIGSEYVCFITPGEAAFGSANSASILRLFAERPTVLLFDLVLLYTLSIIITLLTKRLWVSCAAIGTLAFILSAVSFFKFQNTGEYFYPWDLVQTGNAGLLSDYINTDIPFSLFVFGIVIIAVTVFVLLTRVSLPVKWYVRIPAGVLASVLIYASYSTAEGAERLVSAYGMSFDSVYSGAQNYEENGFIGALMLNVLSETVKSPDEYSEDAISDILAGYTGKGASPEFTEPNVIVILQESFWDIRQFEGCTFSTDPLKNYDDIISRDNVYSGSFISPTFGGGTVRPEFEVLTGLSADYLPAGSIPYQYVDTGFESYVSMFKDLGYSTVAIHPYLSSFYTRDEKYPLLGFDRTLFEEELRAVGDTERRGGFVSDDSFVGYIEHFIEETEEPLFLFGISMEGHQPYTGKFSEDELEINVSHPGFDKELSSIVTQYAQCLMDADASLGRLTSYVDSLEEDTLLVVFGDHAPSLGNDKAAYRQSSFISAEGLTGEDMERILSCPYFIYTNFEAENSTMLKKGENNVISPYNLLNAALELCGAPETPLMELLKDYYSVCPSYNVKLTLDLPPVAQRFVKAHEFLSHDRIRGEGYSIAK